MKIGIKRQLCVGVGVIAFISFAGLLHATTPIIYPSDSGMIDVTQSPYNADKTGVTDATSAIQAAVTANVYNSPTRTIYFPAGTYKISSTINCITSTGLTKDRMSFQGAGQGLTILKLTDNNAAFQSTTTPAGVIHLNNIQGNSANDGLENNVWDMTIDVGVGNPGAIGLDWSCNNLATIRDVTVQSSDPNYAGYAGIYCDGWPGPSLIKNVTVTGFNYGVFVRSNQLGVTMDNITLTHQTLESPLTAAYGIYNNGNGVFLRHVTSTNAVSAVYAGTSGLTTMTNCTLTGTSSSVAAINAQATNTPIYLRHITTSGYSALVKSGSTVMQSGSIPTGEYSSQPVNRLFNNAEAGLMLDPTTDAPEYYDSNLAHWASVVAYGADSTGVADSTAAVQAAINSGATTVYFPMGTYLIGGTVNVTGSVVRIFGNQSVIKTSGVGTVAHPGTVFNIQNGTSSYVILDRLFFTDVGGVYNTVNQATTRQLIIRDSNMGNYANSVTGGSLYLENTQGFTGTFNQMTAYAWQLDTELTYPKIVNTNSTFWVLGLKTENATIAIQTNNGGKTEVLGGFMFSNSATWNTPIFLNNNSQFFGSFEEFNSGSSAGWYADLVRETEGGVTKDLRSWDTPTPLGQIAAYSDNSATPVHAVPTASITNITDGQVYAAGSNVVINDTASASVGTLSSYVIEAVKPFEDQKTANILASNAASYTWTTPAPGNYTLYVKATDNAGVIGYSAPIHIIVKPSLTATGNALLEYWEANGQQWIPDSLSGLVSQLEIFPNYLGDAPDLVTYQTSLSGTATARNLGMRVHGYLQPTTTGTYTFWISSSYCSAFWLSTDATVANKQLVALNDGTLTSGGTFAVSSWRTDNSSDAITLTGGSKYYFEAVQAYNNAGIAPHVEVAWQGPGITQAVIPGTNLLPFDPTVLETQAPPPAGTIYPEADDYVRGGGTAATNYGSLSVLNVAGSGSSLGAMTTYSRYDLSSLSGTITHAVLWMYVDSTVTGDADILESAVQPGGDTWNENGLNYNNQPGLISTSTAGPWTPVAGQWVQQDVTALVQAAYTGDPNKKFSFGIVHNSTGLSTANTVYSSKEDVQTDWPHLVVTTTGGTHTAFVTGQTLGTVASGHIGGLGFQFTVGSSPITVYSLGRWVVSGNTNTHVISLVQVSNLAVLGTVTVNTSGAPAGAYVYATLTTPIALSANTSYYIQSAETSPGDQYYNENTTVTTTSAGTITNAEDSASGGRWFTGTTGTFSYGPVNFTYSSP